MSVNTVFKFYVYSTDQVVKQVRRLPLPSSISWKALKKELNAIFDSTLSLDDYVLQYTDEEGDKITVLSELEWNEALNQRPKNGSIFKINLIPRPQELKQQESNKAELNNKQRRCERRRGHHCSQNKKVGFSPLLDATTDTLLEGILNAEIKEDGLHFDINLPTTTKQLNKKACLLMEEQKYEDAKKILQALLKMDPSNKRALYNLACAEALLGNSESALGHLERAIFFGYVNLHHLMTDNDLISIRSSPKFEELKQKLEKNKNEPRCWVPRIHELDAQAFQLMDEKNYLGAKEIFLKELTILPDYPNAFYNLGCVEALQGNTEAAFDYLQKAIQNGYVNLDHLRNDPDLTSIRETEIFPQLIELIKIRRSRPRFMNSKENDKKKESTDEVSVSNELSITGESTDQKSVKEEPTEQESTKSESAIEESANDIDTKFEELTYKSATQDSIASLMQEFTIIDPSNSPTDNTTEVSKEETFAEIKSEQTEPEENLYSPNTDNQAHVEPLCNEAEDVIQSKPFFVESPVVHRSLYPSEFDALMSMGFMNKTQNEQLLVKHRGNLDSVINELLSN